MSALTPFVSPKSVAVIGASREPQKVGHVLLKNLVESKYVGHIWPVNPQATEILGLQCFPNTQALPEAPELAVVIVPTPASLTVVEDCARQGTRYFIIISAGFKETGPQGAEYENKLKQLVKQYSLRVIGPNCLGLLHNFPAAINLTFAAEAPPPGSVALLSQSGALGTALLDKSAANRMLGMSTFVSLGNKVDVNEVEWLEYLGQDPHTKVILGYAESLPNGQQFMTAAQAVTALKPVVFLKSGTSDAGRHAVSSHTGSLAGADAAYTAAFKQSGVLRARTLSELLDWGMVLAHQPLMESSGVAVVTNAGGPAILATDALANTPLQLAHLHNVTTQSLLSTLPPAASVKNPVDILGDALSERYRQALEFVAQDSSVAALIVILTPQSMTEIAATAQVIAKLSSSINKPMVASFLGKKRVEEGIKILNEAGIPNYSSPERAVSALTAMFQYSQYRRSIHVPQQNDLSTPNSITPNLQTQNSLKNTPFLTTQITSPQPLPSSLSQVFEVAKQHNQPKLPSLAALQLAHFFQLPTPLTVLTSSPAAAVQAATHCGYPVVLKLESPQLIHKTEFKAVKTNLSSPQAVQAAYQELLTNAQHYAATAQIDGVLVQKQLEPGVELLVGMKRDPDFGPLITFGLGGIYVEVFKDVTWRLAPLTLQDAHQLITEIKAYPLLRGVRGQPSINIQALVALLMNVSQMVMACSEIKELDINPVIATAKGVWAVDVRVMI